MRLPLSMTPIAAAILLPALVSAELQHASLCGTFEGRAALELQKHAFLDERRVRDPLRAPRALRAAPRFDVVSDLVVMVDDGTVVGEANPFDLHRRSLELFRRSEQRYYVESGAGPIEPNLGDRIVIGDDESRLLELAFSFPFFGREHQRVFLNSDGNLTFEEGDDASTPRSLARFLSGPPRIAPFFSDLNPAEGGVVRVLNAPDRLVVSWESVPEFDTSDENTVQLELSADGTIRMRYGAVASTEAVIGLSPGGSPDAIAMVDLDATAEEVDGAVVERFQRSRTIDNVALSRAFYREFPDAYDWLVVWTNFSSDLDDAFAFASPVSNQVTGIGIRVADDADAWGSAGELESFVFMGDLGRYPTQPTGRVTGAASAPTTLGLLAHEVGHRFLARARVLRSGISGNILLGRQSSHWSFFFNSDASFLEGNEIEQESETRFITRRTVSRYSRLDLYLMGLAPAAEVAPFFVVDEASARTGAGPIDNESAPRFGVTITGKRVDFTIDDVEAALGERRPSFEESPKTFRQAWIFLTRPDTPASSEEIAKLLDARDAFVPFFTEMTLGRGRVELTVVR